MLIRRSKFIGVFLAVVMLLSLITPMEVQAQESYDLIIMGTSDIHGHVMPYDYMNDEVNESLGLSKIYTLVEEIREEYDHTLLFDLGDVIQGSVLADYEKNIDPLQEGETHSVINVMNHMGYAAAVIGNHELTDYGLDYFHLATAESDFPWLSANVYDYDNPEERYFQPYEIITEEIGGHEIDFGVIGFTPSSIMRWGSDRLTGKILAEEILDEAEKIIPEVAEEADIVIVLAHSGIDTSLEFIDFDNVGYQLSQRDDIDALLLGHQHDIFPNDFEELEGVDFEKGLLNGTPTTMMGQWGSHLGTINLELSYENGDWDVVDGSSRAIPSNEEVESSPFIEDLIEEKHNQVLDYIRQAIVENEIPINSYFSRVIDSTLNEIINEAQIRYGENFASNSEEYSDHNVLAAAAPFRAGRGGPYDYTEIDGDITMSDINSIYMYPNTIRIVELTGAQVLDWLEAAARNFNQVNPELEEAQNIIDEEFRGYYWDVIDGIDYEIDITKPAGERIVNPSLQGKALDLEEEFLVVTNDHRAVGGGNFPHLDGSTVVHESTTTNQEAIIDYLREYEEMPEIDNNWSIKPFVAKGDLIFRSSPEGEAHIEEASIDNIKYLETDDDGWGIYKLLFIEEEPTTPVFPDIEDHWGQEAIETIADLNIIEGYPDGNFMPDGDITRAEFSKMIVKAIGLDLVEYDDYFKDINEDHWYADYVVTLESHDIVKGYPDGNFMPNRNITREEMAEILSNIEDIDLEDDVEEILDRFIDNDDIANWARKSVAKAVHAELMEGHNGNTFGPKETATRAQAATIIARLIK